MAFKSAIGKKTTVSKPVSGTVKFASPMISNVGLQSSKQSKSEEVGIEKIDSAPPAEIIAISDFNRIYDRPSHSGKSNKTEYGYYYDALKSIHSITTEDVSYVISKALENDPSGQWASLKNKVENDIANATDFVNDLSRFLNSLERAERSLDFGRKNDEEFVTAAQEFLRSRVKSYERQPENRNFDPKEILADDFDNDSNVDILRKMLGILRESLTLSSESSYKEFLNGVGQKRQNDLNASDSKTSWPYVDLLPETTSDRLASCAEILSHVLSISSGIPRVQNDPISSKISFKPSNIDSIFYGIESFPASAKSPSMAQAFARKSLGQIGPASSTISLALLQFNTSDGKVSIPVEIEDDPKVTRYKSGPNALVRKPVLDGEFTFSDLQRFSDKFQENVGDIDSYLNLMLGQADPSNKLTPVEILRIIIKNFSEGLDLASKSFDSMLQLLAIKTSTGGGISFSRSSAAVDHPRQNILRVAARIKFYSLSSADISSTSNDESSPKQNLATTRTSEDSTSILSNAKVTTTLTNSKSSDSGSSLGKRIIARLASDSPAASDMAAEIYNRIKMGSSRNAMSKQDINNRISEKNRELTNLRKKKDSAEIELIAAIGITVYASLLSAGLAVVAGAGSAVNSAIKKVKLYDNKIAAAEEEITDLQELRSDAVKFVSRDDAVNSLTEAQKKTTGNLFSKIVSAYDEILNVAESKLPSDQTMTKDDGTTRYANLDEFGLLSLVVECFAQLSTLVNISSEVDSASNINPFRPSKGAVKSLQSDLLTLVIDEDDSEIGSVDCEEGEPARIAVIKLLNKQQRAQDVLTYLNTFSQILSQSTNELVENTADLLNDPTRRRAIDEPQGRQMVGSLTTQQIIYRRSLLSRYVPIPDLGYLPARVVYSKNEDEALNILLSSPAFSNVTSENQRIITLAIPTGVINNERRYVEKAVGEINRSGMLEVLVGRKDHELDDLIFKEKIFLFDPQLFLTPDSFSEFGSLRSPPDQDAALSIAKRLKFTLYDRDSSSVLSYNELRSNPRYSRLTTRQVNEIVRNTTISYLVETYLFKICGSLLDESISLKIDDSISKEGLSALIALSGLGLSNLVLPPADQMNEIIGEDGEVDFGVMAANLTTGDKELIASLTSSFLVRNDSLVNRVLMRSSFDRVLSVVVDPDDFEIDQEASIKQNGNAAQAMLESLTKQDLLLKSDSSLKLKSRDPMSGGFSIGSMYAQFIPHTVSSEAGSLLSTLRQSLTTRLSALPNVGFTGKSMSLKGSSKKQSASITNPNLSKKIKR